MRQLNEQEKELTNRNLKGNQEEIETLRKNLAYNLALITKQIQAREFDDSWRDYLRDQKDKEDKRIIEMITNEIENHEETIKICQDQLTNGVEERINPIVQ